MTGVLLMTLAGCGSNQFDQEVVIEESAVKFARETVDGDYEVLSTSEVNELLDGDEDILLVDAMPPAASYNQAHIPGAVNFEFPKEVMATWDETTMGDRTKEDYQKLLGEDLDRPIVVYCGFVKCTRSHNGAVFAKELGYTNVRRYAGGIYAWRGAGHPLEGK
jgi:rhodanese-related sulfurtransferase